MQVAVIVVCYCLYSMRKVFLAIVHDGLVGVKLTSRKNFRTQPLSFEVFHSLFPKGNPRLA